MSSVRLRAAALCMATAFASSACQQGKGGEARAPRQPPVVTGSRAPAYNAASLNGGLVAFGGVSSRITLLNVWATWCRSCKEEFAELEHMRRTYEGKGLRVVAVSVDQGSSAKVQSFVAAQGSQFPVVHDHDARISSLYGVGGLPSTYLIGRDGRVLWALTGSFLEDSANMYAAIRKATTAQ